MSAPDIRFVSVRDIDVASDRLRPVDDNWAAAIAMSIDETGRQNEAITIRPAPDAPGRFLVVIGAHRLRAAQLAGHADILSVVTDADATTARLMEIDENLIRHELTALDRAVFLAERKRIWEQLHPETRRGVSGGKARQNSASEMFSFAREVGVKVGLTPRSIQLDVALVRDLDPAAVALIRSHPVARKASELKALARLAPEFQREVAQKLADGEATNVRGAIGATATATPGPADRFAVLWDRATTKDRRRMLVHIGLADEVIDETVSRWSRRK